MVHFCYQPRTSLLEVEYQWPAGTLTEDAVFEDYICDSHQRETRTMSQVLPECSHALQSKRSYAPSQICHMPFKLTILHWLSFNWASSMEWILLVHIHFSYGNWQWCHVRLVPLFIYNTLRPFQLYWRWKAVNQRYHRAINKAARTIPFELPFFISFITM